MIKDETDDRTETSAHVLDPNASTDEIATMFDGKPVSPESRANAEALISRVNSWKREAREGRLTSATPLL